MENGQKFPFFLALTLLVVLDNNFCTGCWVYIESPEVTDYGDWSDIYSCPGTGEFVTGMQLKTEAIDPSPWADNTALNGIAFTCASPLCENVPTFQIWALVGPWGTWGTQFTCPNYGYVVGFQMRSQVEQGSGDNTAANNLRMVCNDGSGKLTVFEGDGETLGDWTAPQLCPQGMALTAMQTQVETGEDSDHTALNNLGAFCTNAPFPC